MALGFLTIGQSPRTDVTSELPDSLRALKIVEAGALDNLTATQIESLRPQKGETIYVSRLRNGSEVMIAKERLIPLLNEKTKALEGEGVETIVVLCSGKLELKSAVKVIFPSSILEHVVQSLLNGEGRLGVLVPEETQVEEAIENWSAFAQDVNALCFSPYGRLTESLDRLAKALSDRDLIVLDCIGYTRDHRKTVTSVSRTSVISARSITFRLLEELMT